ncbi:glycerate kinase family protein [Oceanirhabdus sp. W0125-5]|uniref:glycerate kinase family protein n=1 Tax=Oceanirhabdus sp. W0125-5 TaxID=2999116 RepID=UPI0022F335A1|nr:glycerate kinase [Oceanirhabdus sp. W0125-5]WBW99025.1 glycerate kinase [Oceanirhabdus sp. W0125-5]
MKIVVAPDSFKGSLTAKEACEYIEKGIKKVFIDAEIIKVPMADGGEGTVQSLVDCTSGELISVKVKDPLFRDIDAFYGILGDRKTAVIEMAAASGLPLLKKEERNPMKTSTYGTGELIKDALDRGCRNIIIGIGGSATNDGGAGMVKALGGKLLDKDGNDIGVGGEGLEKLDKIDLSQIDRRIKECKIIAACDVDNPLCGLKGASYVFAPQKGANEEMVEKLDKNLFNFAEVIKENMSIDIKDHPGAGAAGGLGAGLMAFLNAELRSGINIVTETVKLEDKIKGADFVITGEGMIDFQTQFGKTPFGVATLAKKYGIPVIAIAGSIGKGSEILYEKGFDGIFSISEKPMTLEESMSESRELIERTAERVMRVLKIKFNRYRR